MISCKQCEILYETEAAEVSLDQHPMFNLGFFEIVYGDLALSCGYCDILLVAGNRLHFATIFENGLI